MNDDFEFDANLAMALKAVDIPENHLNDLRLLYETPQGFPFVLDKKNAPQGETINSSRRVGSALKKQMGITGDKPYGMSLIGEVDDSGSRWRMNANFRAALDELGWFEKYEPNGREAAAKNASNLPRLLSDVDGDFRKKLIQSTLDSSSARLQRLASAERMPARVSVTTFVYARNPDVVAEVLFRANGTCQSCGDAAPFLKKFDGTPYLEVHHRQPLSRGGEDTVINAVALCPNCHREMHFGV